MSNQRPQQPFVQQRLGEFVNAHQKKLYVQVIFLDINGKAI